MRRRTVLAMLTVLIMSSPGAAKPQQNIPRPSSPDSGSTGLDILREEIESDRRFLAGRAADANARSLEGAPDSVGRALYMQARHAFYRKLAADYAYTTRVYSWQMGSSVVIFVFVMGLVAAGLWFSWLQFRIDIRRRESSALAATRVTASSEAAVPKEVEATSNLKLGLQGIEVSSSVLGVLILTISLAFFYLYLVYVYPISEVK